MENESVNIEEVILKSIDFIEKNKYKSFDVFDALTNPFLNKITSINSLFRRITIQLNAKSFINFRFLGMKPMVHTKTLSDMLQIYSLLYQETGNTEYLVKAEQMYKSLIDIKLNTNNGIAWGLNFPYTSRFISADVKMPNLYNTTNSALALLDYYTVAPSKEIENTILQAISFIIKDLQYVEIDNHTGWIRYYPNQKIPTFNVNALAAYFFVKANTVLNQNCVDNKMIGKILSLLTKYQNKDGSWGYALSENGKWVDGFHTGYILESLSYIHSKNQEFNLLETIRKGFNFYINKLFTKDYVPKYYPHKRFPIESQNCAQAIQTIALLRPTIDIQKDVLINVIDQTLKNLYNKEGYFYYKKEKFLLHKNIYFRWSQTPMILALVYSNRTLKEIK